MTGALYHFHPVNRWEVSDISPRRIGRWRSLYNAGLWVCCSLKKSDESVARELAPARLRSSRKPAGAVCLVLRIWQVLGPLRGPAGASSLATGLSIALSEQH